MTENADVTAEIGLVYIHGAGLGPWIWEDVVERIEAPQLSVTFPGRGETPLPEEVGLAAYVEHVHEQVEEWPVEHVIVVGHSIGGLVGVEVADELRDRVVGFVGVCATVPRQGDDFLHCFPFPQWLLQRLFIRLAGTKPPESAIRGSLCRGLSAEQADRVVDRFTPEARRLYTDRRQARVPNVPTLYVETTDDPELGRSLQESMIENLGADTVATIAAGHVPMLSHPGELAEILDRFRADVASEPAASGAG